MNLIAFQQGFIEKIALDIVGDLAGTDRESISKLFAGVGTSADLPGLPLQIQIGGPHRWSNVMRMWRNPKYGFGTKLKSTALTPYRALKSALGLSDDPFENAEAGYMPRSHSIYVKNPSLPLVAHELGHAMDQLFLSSDWKEYDTAYNKFIRNRAIQEHEASQQALGLLKKYEFSPEEIEASRLEFEKWFDEHFPEEDKDLRKWVDVSGKF